MKVFILTILLFLKVQGFGQTSIYHPFPEGNAIWNVYHSFHCSTAPPPNAFEYYTYYFGGDTTIGSFNYHKIMSTVGYQYSTCMSTLTGFQGLIRQDTVAKKVYFIDRISMLEEVLYDFTLNVGDTFPNNTWYCSFGDSVTSIDSVLIGSSYRKQWNFRYSASIVEGIGSTGDMMRVCSPVMYQDFWHLRCFSQNGQQLYPDTLDVCQALVGIDRNVYDPINVITFPNPFRDQSVFYFNNDDHRIFLLDVYDVNGRIVHSQNISKESNILHRNNLNSGVYFYRLSFKTNRVGCGKLLIE